MKKILFVLSLFAVATSPLYGQSFDWNLRGGLNLMDSKTIEDKLAVYGHVGLQAGLRISSFGLYGEVLYSVLENQYGGDAIGYLTPSLLLKTYVFKVMFVEIGGTMFSMAGDSGIANDQKNADGNVNAAIGLGAHFSKFEISMRSIAVDQFYAHLQLTAAFKF